LYTVIVFVLSVGVVYISKSYPEFMMKGDKSIYKGTSKEDIKKEESVKWLYAFSDYIVYLSELLKYAIAEDDNFGKGPTSIRLLWCSLLVFLSYMFFLTLNKTKVISDTSSSIIMSVLFLIVPTMFYLFLFLSKGTDGSLTNPPSI